MKTQLTKIFYLAVVVLGFLIFFLEQETNAKDLFVTPSGGNDSLTWENNDISHPWATVSKAFLTAKAGDTVYFRGGTYSITSKIYTSSGNDGTAAAPITFKNYSNETVTINGNCGGASIFGIEQSYIYVDGLNFVSPGFSAEGAIFYIAENSDATNFKATNCNFTITSYVSGDNVAAIRLQSSRARNALIKNCNFAGPNNNCGVQIIRTTSCVIENCVFRNLNKGIMMKHSNTLVDTGISFSKNVFYNCAYGIASISNYAKIENNLLIGCSMLFGDDGGMGDGYVGADYNTINHNTLYNGRIDFEYQTNLSDPNKGCLHNIVTNNIIMLTTYFHPYSDIAADIKSDYNLYSTPSSVLQNRITYNLDAWRTKNSSDSHSISGTPTFVGGSGISSYVLASGSPGKGMASDYDSFGNRKDMGADISLIGVQSDTTKPNTPSGVTVKILP